MAETGIAIRLSLKDAEVVTRGLEQLGGQGERALKRIEAAARSMGHEAPAAFRAIEVAAERAQGKFEEFAHHGGTIGKMLEQFGPAGLGAAAGVGAMTLAFDRLTEGAKESFEQMHKLETASERLGIGVTALQELHFAFGHLGIDAGEADAVIAKLNKSLGQMALGGAPKQVADAFARLGLSARDAHGEIESVDEFLPEFAEAIRRVGNPAQQTALAVAVLGRNGALLLPALREGAEGIEHLTERARETGAVLDTAFVKEGAEITKTLHDMASASETSFKRIETASGPLLTTMQRLKTEFTSALADFFESFRAIEDRSSVALRHESEALARQIKLQEQNVEVAKQPRNLLERSLASVGLNRPQDLEIRQDEEFLEKLKKQKAEIDAQLARREEENKAKPPPAGRAEDDKPDRAAAAAARRAEAEARAAERMRETNEKVIAALKRDYEGFDDARQKAIDDALARLNEQGTPAQRQAVSDLAAAIYDKREADRQAAEAAREHQKVMHEGTRITEGVRTEAEKYSDTLQHLSDLQQQGAIDAETYRRAVDKANADFAKATKPVEDSQDKLFSFEDALKGVGVAAESSFEKAVAGGQKFSEILQGLAADLEKLALRQAVTQPLMKLLDQGAGIAGDWLKGLFSSSPTPVPSEGSAQAGPGAYAQLPFAHGDVIGSGNVIPFARGGLVDRPTLFPMGRGLGLMGEAGPEAVMPLRRLPSGDLGVAAGGAGVTVNVINNAGAQVTTQERKDQRGGLTIDVMIDAVEQAMAQRAARPGTALNRALAAAANPIKAR